MDKFFLGVMTGLGSLVVPLLLSSLFLPGPDGTSLRFGSGGNQAAKAPVQQTATPADPTSDVQLDASQTSAGQWTRQGFPESGFSIETPKDWQSMTVEELQALGISDSFGAAAAADAMVLAVTNSKSQDDQTATVVLFDLGQLQVDPLQMMQSIETQIVDQVPLLTVNESATSAKFAKFGGASLRLETATGARLLMPNVDQKFSAIKIGDRMIFVSSTIKPGEGFEEIISHMEQSLRTN